jgi:hypothetical protein
LEPRVFLFWAPLWGPWTLWGPALFGSRIPALKQGTTKNVWAPLFGASIFWAWGFLGTLHGPFGAPRWNTETEKKTRLGPRFLVSRFLLAV